MKEITSTEEQRLRAARDNLIRVFGKVTFTKTGDAFIAPDGEDADFEVSIRNFDPCAEIIFTGFSTVNSEQMKALADYALAAEAMS